jgi:hypothetical protein
MAVLRDRHTSGCADQVFIIARGGVDVCDGAHRCFVMKKGRRRIAELGMLARPGIIFDPATGSVTKPNEDAVIIITAATWRSQAHCQQRIENARRAIQLSPALQRWVCNGR